MGTTKFEQSLHRQASSFRGRVALAVAILVGVSLSIAGVGIWGVVRIHEDSSIALRGYRQLREVYEVGVYVSQARQAMNAATPDPAVARQAANLALARLDLFTSTDARWLDESKTVEGLLREDLARAPAVGALDSALARLAMLAAQVRTSVEAHETAAVHEKRVTLTLLGVFSGAFLILSALIGVMHYRSVMHPIDRLAETVRQFASGHLDARVQPSGHREFAQLAQDLNHMADELQSLYRDLERKVEQKSRELVKSERLASVGYLAAGVAHEINNPLGIIAAYAERALQRLRRGALDAASAENAQQAFQIICDEAFRCKEITDRLLTMARSGSEGRTPVSIHAIAQEVIAMLAGLPQFKHVNLTLRCDDCRNLTALVNDAEIKQVLLNLIVNAAEAIEHRDGHVDLAVTKADDEICIRVCDNGRGMENDTLQRIFEPFFSDKKSQRHGTGLGLSICHAIIESHGGRLLAHSNGAGKGSTFSITLPVAKEASLGSA